MTAIVPSSLRGYVYKPRTVASIDRRMLGRWQVKATVITVRGTVAHFPDVVEAGWSTAETLLAEVADDGRDAGVAHLTLHLGLTGVRLLLTWWSEGDKLSDRLSHAAFDDPTRFAAETSRRYGLCLWEMAVQAHERDAWLRHVLANPAGPDIEGYLQDGLNAHL